MNGGRGAKGSINDRLISMMYRNRYKKYQLKKEAYALAMKRRELDYLKYVQNFDIADGTYDLDNTDTLVVDEALNDIKIIDRENAETLNVLADVSTKTANIHYGNDSASETLHALSEQMVQTPQLTSFDFDNYDYYQVIGKGAKISEMPSSEIIDVDKEITKVDDEITIVEELEEFIDDSRELLEEIKTDVETLRRDVKEQYTLEQMAEIQTRYALIKDKIDKLKAQYEAVSHKYNFEDFHLLDNIKMMSAIEEYRNLATLDEVETLVEFCKDEIEQIDGIVIEHEQAIHASEDIEEQEKKIIKREKDFQNNQTGVIYLDDLEKKIACEAAEQRRMIAEIEVKLANFKTDIVEVTNVVFHTEKLFGSFLRIAAGILTAPFSGRNVFGTYLGVQLLNKGIRDLRASLEPEYVKKQEIVHSYTSVESEILKSIDHVRDTSLLIEDSLYQLELFDEEFKSKFKDYSSLIPEYGHLEKQIANLKKKLERKQNDVKTMQADLSRQYEINKVKVKKAA